MCIEAATQEWRLWSAFFYQTDLHCGWIEEEHFIILNLCVQDARCTYTPTYTPQRLTLRSERHLPVGQVKILFYLPSACTLETFPIICFCNNLMLYYSKKIYEKYPQKNPIKSTKNPQKIHKKIYKKLQKNIRPTSSYRATRWRDMSL